MVNCWMNVKVERSLSTYSQVPGVGDWLNFPVRKQLTLISKQLLLGLTHYNLKISLSFPFLIPVPFFFD